MQKSYQKSAPIVTMSAGQHVLFVVIGIILSVITSVFLEATGYAKDMQHFFFGNVVEMGQYKSFIATNYFKGIKMMMAVLACFFVLYICFFVFYFEVFAVIFFIMTGKRKKPAVFISYKNSAEEAVVDTTKIATTIKDYLVQKGFDVKFVAFNAKAKHDNVNAGIQQMIRGSDAVIAIPDPYKPSYVDAEIANAAIAFKPIYIIKHIEDQQLPTTANSGHTVLLWNKLQQWKYEPLSILLKYVHNVWYTRLFIIGYPFVTFLTPLMWFDELEADKLALYLLLFGIATTASVYFGLPIAIALTVIKLVIGCFGVIAAYSTSKIIATRIILQDVIRQRMVDAGSTFEYFKAADIDEKVLDTIDKKGLLIAEEIGKKVKGLQRRKVKGV